MDRRRFLTLSGMGAMTLLFGGCSWFGETASAPVAAQVPSKGDISGGKKMNIVLISSSPHPKDESTSIYLADRFTAGAQSVGHTVFTFDAANEDTHPCRACDYCDMDGPCVWQDAIEQKLMPKMLAADMLVLVTPLYYYSMSAQLKTIVDRFYSRTGKLHGKKSLLIATAYNSADWTMEALVTHYDTLVRYMEWEDAGKVLGIGCGSRSLVEKSDFGNQAYQLGANL